MKQLKIFLVLVVLAFAGTTSMAQPGRVIFHSSNKPAAAPPAKVSIRINLSNTDLNVATYNDLFGPPGQAVRSIADLVDITGAATGIGITTISTANWAGYSANPVNTANDPCCSITGAPFYGSSANTATVGGSNFYNSGTVQPARYDAAKPQFRITGLDPAKTYEIKITTTDGSFGFNDVGIFRIVGLTTPSAITVDGNVTSQTVGATFTLQPTSGGQLDIWANTDAVAGADIVMVPAIFITEQ